MWLRMCLLWTILHLCNTEKVHEFLVLTEEANEVHQFVGVASYHRHIVLGFACIVNQLHSLARKKLGTKECEHLKNYLMF